MTWFSPVPKRKRISDRALLDRVKLEPCCACGHTGDDWNPIDPAHVTSKGAGGDDTEDNVMPLCRTHHTMQHKIGWVTMVDDFPGVMQWLKDHGRAINLR